MKAATYCRYSSTKQRETSIEDQFRNCEQYAQRAGWMITIRYEDKAISGTERGRPGYQQMLADAKAKQFDVLLMDDLSRLGRDEGEAKQAVKRLKFYGVRVIGVSDGVDTAQKGHKITLGFAALKNEVFLDDLKEKIDRGMTGRALAGYSCGGKPYGYRPRRIFSPTEKDAYGDPKVISVDRDIVPEQAEIVREIYARYADGWAPRKIADDLNRRKVPSPGSTWKRVVRRCNGWTGSSVLSILSNPVYGGKYLWKRARWEKDPDTGIAKRSDRPKDDWVIVDKPEWRIVTDMAVWERVQARRAELREKNKEIQAEQGKTARYSPPHKYLFSSLLVCGVCGANYVIKDPTRYGCNGNRDGGDHLCNNKLRVSRELLERKLLTGITEDLFSDEAIAHFRRSFARLLAERKRKARPEAEKARKRLAEVEPQIARMVAAIKDGAYSAALRDALASAEAEAEKLRGMLAVDTRRLDNVLDFVPRAVDRYRALVRDLPATLGRDVARARAQLRHLIGRVRLVPEGDHLVAELQGSYAGLFKLAAGTVSVEQNWFGRGRGI